MGCKVENLDTIPNGMIGKSFDEATYSKHIAKGNIMQGMVLMNGQNLEFRFKQNFTADFEVYGKKAQNPETAEVDIFVAIK